MPFGPTANVNVGITAQPQAAAKATQDAFERAFANALKSKVVQSAIADIVKQFNKGGVQAGNQMSTGFSRAFKNISRQGQQTANSLTQAFAKVQAAAQKALSSQGGRGMSPELSTLQQHLIAVTGNMQQLANASRQTFLAVEEVGRSARAAARSADQQARTAAQVSTQSERLQIANLQKEAAAIRASGEVRRASISAVGQVTLQTMRTVERAVSATFRGATTVVRAFATGAGAALRTFANSARTTFSGIERAASTAFRGMGRLLSTFGRGLTSALAGVSRAFQSAFRRDENALNSSLRRRESAMRSSQSRMGSLLSPGGLGLLAGGAGVGGFLTSGFERFGQQEQLQLTFEALLRDGPRATQVLSDISDFARTTSFDFVEVASSVAQLTATLGDVDQAFDMTKFLADVTALTGGTTESLGRVRLAMTQIASAGRLDSANLRQLTESLPGVPFAQILADRFFGGDVSAYAKARDEGELGAKITAEAFFNAFQEGVQSRFPEIEGFAQTAATTVTGLTQNLKENFAIFGATIIGLAEGPIKGLIDRANEALGVLGDFVKGTGAFAAGGGGFSPQNPFANTMLGGAAAGGVNTNIPFEQLPPEMQEILTQLHGWQPGQGFFLATQDAAELWEQLHPDAQQAAGIEDGANQLREIRDIVFDFAKGAGFVTALAASFKILGFALGALINPFTLLVALGGLLGVAFGQIYDASEPLRNSLKFLQATLGPLLDSLKGLGGALLDAFFRLLGAEDTQAGFRNIGKFMSDVVNSISRGAAHLTEWVNWASEMIDLGEGGQVLDDINDRFQTLLGRILGLNDQEISWSKFLGGNDFGNILTTFIEKVENLPIIGPVVRLGERIVSGLRTAIGTITDFISGIWESAFSGSGVDRTIEGAAAAGLGLPGPGVGTNILDFLETTFLDPVVSWFRTTFVDGIHGLGSIISSAFNSLFSGDIGAGGGTGAVGITPSPGGGGFLTPIVAAFRSLPTTIKNSGWESGLAGIWDGLTASAGRIWDGDNGQGGIKAEIAKIPGLISDFFGQLNWADLIVIGGATATGALAGGPVGGVIAGGLATTGVLTGFLDPIVNAIEGGWEGSILPALQGLRSKIGSFLTTEFTGDRLKTKATFLLDFIHSAGELVGNVATDKIFLGAVGGIGAAAVIVVGQFTAGLASALSGAYLDWATTIGHFLEDAWKAIAPDFIPDPIVNALADVFGTPTLGAVALLGGLGLGAVIVQSLISGVTSVAPALIRGAGGLVGMLFGKQKVAGDKGYGVGGYFSAFQSTGAAIAGAVVAGILDFEIGRQAGRSGSVGNVILSILTGGAAGAALGTAIAPGVGTAVGAALGAAVAGIGAAFGGAAAEAQKAKEETQEYFDVLLDQSAEAQLAGATQTVLANLQDEAESTQEFFRDAGFNARDFADQVLEGNYDVTQSFMDVFNAALGAIPADVMREHAQTINDLATALQNAAEDGRLTGDELDQIFSGVNGADFLQLMDDIGYDSNTLLEVFGALNDESSELEKAKGLSALAQDSTAAAEEIDTVKEAMQGVLDIANQGPRGGGVSAIREFLAGADLDPAQKLEAVADAADAARDALQQARTALGDFFAEQLAPTTEEEIRARFRLDLPSIQQDVDRQLQGATGEGVTVPVTFKTDIETTTVADFRDSVTQLLREGFDTGVLNQVNISSFIQGLITDINDQVAAGGLDADLAGQFTDILNNLDLTGIDPATGQNLWTTLADTTNADTILRQAGRDAAGIVGEGYVSSGADIDTGEFYRNLADIEAYRSTFEAAGEKAKDAIIAGFIGKGGAIAGAAGAPSGKTAGTSGIGQGLVDSVVESITAAIPEVTSAGQEVATGFVEGASQGIRPAGVVGVLTAAGLIAGVTPAIRGVGEVGSEAGESLTSGFSSSGSQAVGAARVIGIGMVSALFGVASSMYSIGVNAGVSFASGVRSQVGAAAAAAAAIAAAATNAARRALKISSPSRIFQNIGRDVGRGFIQGIKDSEGDMARAMSDSLSKAVAAAVRAAHGAVERSQAATRIFELLAPSRLPGGTTAADAQLALLGQRVDIAGFRGSLQAGAADRFADTTRQALADAATAMRDAVYDLRDTFRDQASTAVGEAGNSSLYEARNAIVYLGRNLAQHVLDMRDQFREAQQAQQAFADYDKTLAQIKEDYRTGALGQQEYAEQLEQLRLDYRAGRLDSEAYNERVAALNKELSSGVLNIEAYREAIQNIGDRPDRPTYAQQQILRTGATTLNAQFAGGQENIDAISDLFDQITTWGQEAIAAGGNVADTVRQMERFRDSLIEQLEGYGFNHDAILRLVSALGLADVQLENLQRRLTSLDTRTEEGQANRDAITESFEAIRTWAEEALRAGQSADDVTQKMREQRNELIKELRQRGFNIDAINQIVQTLGLSNDAIAEFRRGLTTLNTATIEGAQNRIELIEQFQSIRDFAREMLAAGIPVTDVLANIRTMRNQIIRQAVAFGFNQQQVEKLVEMLGLSNSQLADFIRQLNNFNNEAKNAEKAAQEAAAAAARRKAEEERQRQEDAAKGRIIGSENIPRARINELHVHVPTGDPEAVALVVGNRLAYDRVASW